MRRAHLGLSFLCGFAWGAVGPVRAESPFTPRAEDPRPVILVEHEIEGTSPFAAENPPTNDAPARFPPVPVTRWQPETRWEPAIRTDRVAETRSANSLPIAGSVGASAPTLTVPASGPWPPMALPHHPYAIGGVNPRVPPPRADAAYLARNVWGEATQFMAGQPVRNALRYLAP